MSGKRYPEEFKVEAVKQVIERGDAVADVAARITVSVYSPYDWIKRYSMPESERIEQHGRRRRSARAAEALVRIGSTDRVVAEAC